MTYEFVIAQRRNKWRKALLSGEYLQAQGRLRTAAGYCCLGVACVVFKEDLGIESKGTTSGYYLFSLNNEETSISMPDELRRYLGLSFEDQNVLMTLNDAGVPFSVISSAIAQMKIVKEQN